MSVSLRVSKVDPLCPLPPEEMTFDIRIETQRRVVYRSINRVLTGYKDGHHGPTVVLVQSQIGEYLQMVIIKEMFVLYS